MLIEEKEFDRKLGAPHLTGDATFRFCTFTGLDIEGAGFSGILEGCVFERCEFYWTLFNTATLINVRFIDCVFPGTSFRGCHIVRSDFVNARFILDNVGGSATIDDCSFTECTFQNCVFVKSPRDADEVVAPNTRFYGCTIEGCEGFDGG